MPTERRNLLPPEYFLRKRRHEGEFGLVVKGRQTIGANHAVDFFLGLVLCSRVHQHRKEERQDDRNSLNA
jgi:hypothetical protein